MALTTLFAAATQDVQARKRREDAMFSLRWILQRNKETGERIDYIESDQNPDGSKGRIKREFELTPEDARLAEGVLLKFGVEGAETRVAAWKLRRTEAIEKEKARRIKEAGDERRYQEASLAAAQLQQRADRGDPDAQRELYRGVQPKLSDSGFRASRQRAYDAARQNAARRFTLPLELLGAGIATIQGTDLGMAVKIDMGIDPDKPVPKAREREYIEKVRAANEQFGEMGASILTAGASAVFGPEDVAFVLRGLDVAADPKVSEELRRDALKQATVESVLSFGPEVGGLGLRKALGRGRRSTPEFIADLQSGLRWRKPGPDGKFEVVSTVRRSRATIDQAIQRGREFIFRLNRTGVTVKNADDGRVFGFTKRSAGKTVSGPEKAALVDSLPEMLRTAKSIGFKRANRGGGVFHHYVSQVVIDGKPRQVLHFVREDQNGNLFYTFSVIKDKIDVKKLGIKKAPDNRS